MTETEKELSETIAGRVLTWAGERRILQYGSKAGQCLKLVSELGELGAAVLLQDEDEACDAIGDVTVCVTVLGAMFGFSLSGLIAGVIDGKKQFHPWTCYAPAHYNILGLVQSVGELADAVAQEKTESIRERLEDILGGLMSLAPKLSLEWIRCFMSAWEEIKDRTGRMNAAGVWVS